MQNILVFFGGVSVEHDISIITGTLTVNTLRRGKYNAIPVYVDRKGAFLTGEQLLDVGNYSKLDYKKLNQVVILPSDNKVYIKKKNKLKELCAIKCAVNCMHGERGEDGSLSGFLSFTDIPLASPDITASSICMDKSITKLFLKGLKIKTLKSVTLESVKDCHKKCKDLGFPLIVKPCKLGSSIGIKKAYNKMELESAISFALKYGERVLIEPCIENFIEINCACYKDEKGRIIVSECEQPIGKDEILTFSDKYENGSRVFPANIDKELSDEIKKTTLKIYSELNVSGIIRIDYIIKEKEIYLNEINTVPGSLAYYLFTDTLAGFEKILEKNILLACFNKAKQNGHQKNFSCKVLDGVGIKGNKRL